MGNSRPRATPPAEVSRSVPATDFRRSVVKPAGWGRAPEVGAPLHAGVQVITAAASHAAAATMVAVALLAVAGVSGAWAQGRGGTGTRPESGATRVDTTAAERAIQALNPKYQTSYDVTQQRRIWKQQLDLGFTRGSWKLDGITNFDVNTDQYQDAVNKSGKVNLNLANSGNKKLPLSLRITYARNNFRGQDSRDDVSTSATLGISHTRRFGGGAQTFRLEGGLEGQEQENTNRITKKTAITSNNGVRGSANWNGAFKPTQWVSLTGRAGYTRAELTSRTTDREAPTFNQNKNISGDIKFLPFESLTTVIRGKLDKNDYVKTRSVSGTDAFITTNSKNQRLDIVTTYTPPGDLELVGEIGVYRNQNLLRPDRDDPDLAQLVRQSVSRTGNSWSTRAKGEAWGVVYESKLSNKFDETTKVEDDPSELHSHKWEGKITRPFGLTPQQKPKFNTKANWFIELRSQKDITAPKRRFDYDELLKKWAVSADWAVNPKWQVGSTFEASYKDRIEQNPRRAKSTLNQRLQTISTHVSYALSDKTRLSQNYSIVADFREKIFDTSRNTSTISRRITTNITTRVLTKVNLGLSHRWSLLKTSSFLDRERGLVVFPQSKTWSQDLSVDLKWELTPWLSWVSQEQLIRRDFLREIDQVKSMSSRDFRLIQGIDIKQELGVGFSVSGQGRYQRSNVRASYTTISARLDKDF